MPHPYDSIGAFRASLNNLVTRTNTGQRSRPNMAIRKHGAVFDTPQELIEYEQAMGISAPAQRVSAGSLFGVGEAPVRKPARAPRTGKSGGSKEKSGGSKGKAYHDPYAKIAASVGGSRDLCPGIDWDTVIPGSEYGRYGTLLQEAGLTPERAQAVLAAMDDADVLTHGSGAKFRKSKEAQETARQILLRVGGVRCPIKTSLSNPRGRRRSW